MIKKLDQDQEVRVAAAAGVAGNGSNDLSVQDLEAAMTEATEACFRKGITDPDKVRDAKLAARDKVRKAASARIVKAQKEAARRDRA